MPIPAPRPDPELAGEPGHCCLCGQRNPRCLCRRCRLAHLLPDGTTAPAIRELQRQAQRLTARERRYPNFALLTFDFRDSDEGVVEDLFFLAKGFVLVDGTVFTDIRRKHERERATTAINEVLVRALLAQLFGCSRLALVLLACSVALDDFTETLVAS